MEVQAVILTSSVGDVIKALSKACPEAAKRVRDILVDEADGILQSIERPPKRRATIFRSSRKLVGTSEVLLTSARRRPGKKQSPSSGTLNNANVSREPDSDDMRSDCEKQTVNTGQTETTPAEQCDVANTTGCSKSTNSVESAASTQISHDAKEDAKLVKAFDQKLLQFRRDRRGAIRAINSDVVPARAASLCILFETWHNQLGTVSSQLDCPNSVSNIAGIMRLLFDNTNQTDVSVLVAATYLDEVPFLATAHLAMLCRADIHSNGTTNRSAVATKLKLSMQKAGAKLPSDITKDEHLLYYADAGTLFMIYPCLRFLFSGSVLEIGRNHASIEKQVEENKSLSCLLRCPNPIFIPNTISCAKASCTTNLASVWRPTTVAVPCYQRGNGCREDGWIRQGPCLICNKLSIWFPGFCSACARLMFGVRVSFKNPHEGYGLFAARKLTRGYTLKYEGRVIDHAQLTQEYGGHAFYGAQLEGTYTIVADEFRSLASMANHSAVGNMRILYDTFGLVVLEALEDICEGDELTYEYSDRVVLPSPRKDMYSPSLDYWISGTSETPPVATRVSAEVQHIAPSLPIQGECSQPVLLDEISSTPLELRMELHNDAQLLLHDVQPLFDSSDTVLPLRFISYAKERNSRWTDKRMFTAAYKGLRAAGLLETIAIEGEQFLKLCDGHPTT